MGFGSFGGGGGRILYETVEEDLSAWGPELFGDPTKFITWAASMNPVCANDAAAQVLYFPKSLHIPAGVTMTPSNRCKGLIVYVNGHLKVDGTISMSARGASAAGAATPLNAMLRKERRVTRAIGSRRVIVQDLYDQMFGTIGTIPATGGAGGAAREIYTYHATLVGLPGTAGTNRACGGGGSGGASCAFDDVANHALSGRGGNGTSYSGGPGGGGCAVRDTPGAAIATDGSDSGGAGGNAARTGTALAPRGGVGNPGGLCVTGENSPTGTGGVFFCIVRGTIWISSTGSIVADGVSYSSPNGPGGGASGAGSINIGYGRDYQNAGTVQANGGVSSGYSAAPGGAGGAGCITIEHIAGLLA